MLRDLQSHLIGKLVVIPGIITHASRSQIKATRITVRCKACGNEKTLSTGKGFGSLNIPRTCDSARNPGAEKSNCGLDSYTIVAEKCEYID